MATPADPTDLYALPLEEFTAARNALAKEMGASGDKAAAAEVKRLPKPNKTAWALNQVARQRPEDVRALLQAGSRLREAQEQALEGDASQLRTATRAEQERVDALVDAALGILGSNDAATADRLRQTLRAAATEAGTGTLLTEGRLVADMEATGFGLEGLSVPTGDSKPSDAHDDERARRQERRQAAREAERLQKEAAIQHNRARRLVDEAERAEQRSQQARREADAALETAAKAQEAADDAAGAAVGIGPGPEWPDRAPGGR